MKLRSKSHDDAMSIVIGEMSTAYRVGRSQEVRFARRVIISFH